MIEKLKKMLERSKSRARKPTYDDDGRLVCDENPLKYAAGLRKPPTNEERLMRLLREHDELKAFNSSYADETDFNIDTQDMLSPYEQHGVIFELEPEFPASENVSGDQDTPPSQETPPAPSQV